MVRFLTVERNTFEVYDGFQVEGCVQQQQQRILEIENQSRSLSIASSILCILRHSSQGYDLQRQGFLCLTKAGIGVLGRDGKRLTAGQD